VSQPFSRSLRSIRADSFRLTLATVIIVFVLAACWSWWFFFSGVSLYAVTKTARLEVDQEAHPVEAPISGRVIATGMRLGSEVRLGELLVELDSEQIRYQLEEATAKRAGLAGQLDSLNKEVEAQNQALVQARKAESSAVDEARAQYEEADAGAKLAEEEARRIGRIYEQGLVSDSERKRASAEAEQKRSAALAKQSSLERLEADRRFDQSEKQALLAELERQAEVLQSELATSEAAVSRLKHELQLHRIAAPVSGRLGEVVPLQEGAYVESGDRLAAVIPPGLVRVVAEFDPPDALGRIRPQQKARLRLDGFPWVQYGSLPATVDRVANETLTGKIRVELEIDANHSFPVPLQHGLPGILEVNVERVSPAALVLRAAGRLLAQPGSGRGSQTDASRTE
jgi:membrane fusion protein (multidrug efflux system)